jgi:hypothetical protein
VAEEESLSQSASLRAVHEHSRSVVTCSVPLAPVASAIGVDAVSVSAHRVDVGAVALVEEEDPQLAQKASRTPQRMPQISRIPHARGCRQHRIDRG